MEIAGRLLRAGVFPVRVTFDKLTGKNKKSPAISKGTSWKDYKATRKEIEKASHIAVTIPVGTLIFDLDVKSHDTIEALQDDIEKVLHSELDLNWDDALIQNTISGGAHYAFKVPDDAVISQNSDLLGIEGFDIRVAGKGCVTSGEGYTLVGYDTIIEAVDSGGFPELPQAALTAISYRRGSDGGDDLETAVANRKTDLSADEVVDYIEQLPARYADDYGNWLKVGMAIHHQTDGSADGLALFDTFSKRTSANNYNEDKVASKWQSFGEGGGSKITFASIIELVNEEILKRAKAVLKKDVHLERAKAAIKHATHAMETKVGFKIECDLDIAHMMLTCSFWQPKESKLHTINSQDNKVIFAEKDATKMLVKLFGNPVTNYADLCEYLEDADDPKFPAPIKKECRNGLINLILDTIKMDNQRLFVRMDVDMFAKHTQFEFTPDDVAEHYKHMKLVPSCVPRYDDVAVADYKAHFPEFEDVLRMIIGARFASTRKKAYLWIKADSDWGKDVLRVALGSLAIEMSVKEVEKAMEGAPVGKSPHQFRRSMVMVVNEFKGVKSELKQLENSIVLSAKFQLETRVPLYTKLFMSAEIVDSLVGEYGIESQFANRFSIIEGSGDFAELESFKRLGGAVYMDVLRTYCADFMNAEVKRYRGMGYEVSRRAGDEAVAAFHDRYGIRRYKSSIDDNLEELARRIKQELLEDRLVSRIDHSGYVHIQSAKSAIERALFSGKIVLRSEAVTLKFKIDELCKLMSDDGKGNIAHKIGGRAIKSVKLKPDIYDFDDF